MMEYYWLWLIMAATAGSALYCIWKWAQKRKRLKQLRENFVISMNNHGVIYSNVRRQPFVTCHKHFYQFDGQVPYALPGFVKLRFICRHSFCYEERYMVRDTMSNRQYFGSYWKDLYPEFSTPQNFYRFDEIARP